MRLPTLLVIAIALVAAVGVIALGAVVLNPPQRLILEAAFTPSTISPNADGVDDITEITYALARAAQVTISLQSEEGRVFTFRDAEPRAADQYRVLFSGVVDGYVNPGETIAGTVLRRLMPNGLYTWRVYAEGESGETDELTGTFVVVDGDAPLPELSTFDIEPAVFTPNQDGISDRTQINVFVTKPSELNVYLLTPDDQRILIPARVESSRPGEAGLHPFDYEGGVDRNADPPADGTYTVVALARDAVGQEVERRGTLTISLGGKPYGQIVPQPSGATVAYTTAPWDEAYASTRDQFGAPVAVPDDPQDLNLNALTIPLGDILIFKLTVENVGRVPLRTSGPPPGTVYDWDQRAATLGRPDESGAWRVGLDCVTAASDYPWRWAIGSDEVLTTETDPVTGEIYRYLPVGATAVVWGAVRMSVIEARNPQNCWAGLIHEDVGISTINQNVGPRTVEIVTMGETSP